MTVILPCRNEERALPVCLDSIIDQTLSDFELLVIDGGSTDRSRAIVETYATRDSRVRLVENPRGIVPTALNVGLRQAQGTWLVRVDAHCTVPRDYVERLVKILEGGAGGAGGCKLGRGRTRTGKAIAAAMSSRVGVGGSAYHRDGDVQTVDHVPFGAYPVDLARRMGGWNEGLSVNQDFEFDVRVRQAGHELVLDPSVVIDWESRQSFGALFRQYRRYGRGKTRVMRLHPSSIRLRHLAAPAFVVGLAVLSLPLRAMRLPRLVATAGYVSVVAVGGVVSGRSEPAIDRPRVMAALVTMHVGWGLGFWEGIVDHVFGRDDLVLIDHERLGNDGGGSS